MEITEILFHSEYSALFYGFLVIAIGGYIGIAGGSYLYFYKIQNRELHSKKIQTTLPLKTDILRDIKWSLVSTLLWIPMSAMIIIAIAKGWTHLYFEIRDFGVTYFLFSILFLVIAHDTYFYWIHRFMHSSPSIYRLFHRTHHLSKNPTPFSIHAFAPLEAIVFALYVPLMIFLIPVHLYALLIWLFIETVVNTLGHLGYEILPETIFRSRLGSLLSTSYHHNLHHQNSKYGFGHSFNIWDMTMKTNDPEYPTKLQVFYKQQK